MGLLLSGSVALAFNNRSIESPSEAQGLPAEAGDPTTTVVASNTTTDRSSIGASADASGDVPDQDGTPVGPVVVGIEPGVTVSAPTTTGSTSDDPSPSTSGTQEPTTTVSVATATASTSTRPPSTTTTTTAPSTTTTARPTTTTARPTTTTTTLPPPVDLVANGGFEQPGPNPGSYGYFTPTGWTSSAGAIELWATGFNGVSSYSGRQHLELNGHGPDTISQQLEVVPGERYRWSFAHRGRDDRDTVRVLIDGDVVETVTSDPGSWRVVSGTVTIPSGTTRVSFGLQAVDSGSRANLVDAVTFKRVD